MGLEEYVKKFSNLRSDQTANWPETSLGRSPYKPLLLLSVIDLFAQGELTSNLIRLTPGLGDIFHLYCSQVMPPDWRCNIAMPFFHLSREGFWHLKPLPGKEAVIASGRRLQSESLLLDNVAGAVLDEELYSLMCVEKSRDVLRAAIIESFFDEVTQKRLMAQTTINAEAFEYSQQLLAGVSKKKAEVEESPEKYSQSARDQGFRRAVVLAYSHRCALCGIRMLTPDGHTAVAAAHIVPWSISHNDDLRNGMALCHLCHWTFDKGLMGVSAEYRVLTSPRLSTDQNVPGHLVTLSNREILGPIEKELWPDVVSLKWHLSEVFRKV
jgi:putative restriction endonuclease